jgi:hypothetical protein
MMTTQLMRDEYLPKVWNLRPGGIVGHRPRGFLLMDHHASHTGDDVKKDLAVLHDTDVLLIPAGLTSLLQPLDVSVNKAFIAAMRKNGRTWINMQESDALKHPSCKTIVLYVAKIIFFHFISHSATLVTIHPSSHLNIFRFGEILPVQF